MSAKVDQFGIIAKGWTSKWLELAGMRRVLALLCAALIGLPAVVQAGTAVHPEVIDPAGDAFHPSVHGLIADWADITSVWFETMRDPAGTVVGFRAHLKTVGDARADDKDAEMELSWFVSLPDGDRCTGTVHILRIDSGDAWSPGFPFAYLDYGCDSEARPSSFESPVLDFVDGGVEVVVTVPSRVFTSGRSKGLYEPGTIVAGIYAAASATFNHPNGDELGMGLLWTDETEDCLPVTIGPGTATQCASRPFTLGS